LPVSDQRHVPTSPFSVVPRWVVSEVFRCNNGFSPSVRTTVPAVPPVANGLPAGTPSDRPGRPFSPLPSFVSRLALSVAPILPKMLRAWLAFALNARDERVVFLLWGSYARKKAALITNPAHVILEAGHPSPLNPKGFRGSRPFSAANKALADAGRPPIDWDPRA
jgi:uracil-DNA glycosylase